MARGFLASVVASCSVANTLAALHLRRSHTLDTHESNRNASFAFDCYTGNGEDYRGLHDFATSGRRCQNWLNVPDSQFGPTTDGIGNHQYCRNPSGTKARPWCYTVDPNVEWEFCEVPECDNEHRKPEPWVSPEGAKSPEAEAAGPCKYTPPATPKFVEYRSGRACMDNRGSTWWLITNKHTTAADPETCRGNCAVLPGSAFFTFFAGVSEDNCGCYRQCILVDEALTINQPTIFKMA
eukprot:TRINITY_DN112529_c0_g1_i1.p1 TRINITY_DN112529_c0_g1~~TRINITY_DN112529_c0_g1_i1.p1  ORF type:complete len:238 (-),score=18.24 TRINITY_DN112529_c0_g1_i1:162-875(-)